MTLSIPLPYYYVKFEQCGGPRKFQATWEELQAMLPWWLEKYGHIEWLIRSAS